MEEEKSAGAVTFYREKGNIEFLLLHYGKGHWGFPKGHIEANETETQAMLRELEEETGIKDVKIIPNFRECITYFFMDNGKKIKKQVVFFLVESKTKDVKLSFEHTDYAWLPYKKAIETLTFGNARKVLKKAYDFLKQCSLGDFS
jgi:8-oxo-dGTP pyrophosphatase MutT (NUDIX family)